MTSTSGLTDIRRRISARDVIFTIAIIIAVAATFTLGYRARVNRGEKQQTVEQATTQLCIYVSTLDVFLSQIESINRDRARELPRGDEKAYVLELANAFKNARLSASDVTTSCRGIAG